ncbi:MAG: hypothetical protein J6N76_06095, partial [Lachnospiraceae bacterium]|nr:hypothetical protein [Lachnospiraceae bacterium]
TITKNNIELFEGVLGEDIQEGIKTSRLQALGVISAVDDITYGAAAIAWHIDEVPGEETKVLRIDWLYVANYFRGRNLSDFLVGELVALCNEAGIEHITADISVNNEYKQRLARILGMWHFSFDTGVDPDIYIRIGDVTNLRRISEHKKGAKSLSSLDKKKAVQFVKSFLEKKDYKGYLLSRNLPADYIDMELSFFTVSRTDGMTLLLVHRDPLGMVRVEYLGNIAAKESEVEKLVSAFIGKALVKCDDDSIMYFSAEYPELTDFLNRLCPEQLGQHLIEGILSKPEDDMDEDDIKKLLKSL